MGRPSAPSLEPGRGFVGTRIVGHGLDLVAQHQGADRIGIDGQGPVPRRRGFPHQAGQARPVAVVARLVGVGQGGKRASDDADRFGIGRLARGRRAGQPVAQPDRQIAGCRGDGALLHGGIGDRLAVEHRRPEARAGPLVIQGQGHERLRRGVGHDAAQPQIGGGVARALGLDQPQAAHVRDGGAKLRRQASGRVGVIARWGGERDDDDRGRRGRRRAAPQP